MGKDEWIIKVKYSCGVRLPYLPLRMKKASVRTAAITVTATSSTSRQRQLSRSEWIGRSRRRYRSRWRWPRSAHRSRWRWPRSVHRSRWRGEVTWRSVGDFQSSLVRQTLYGRKISAWKVGYLVQQLNVIKRKQWYIDGCRSKVQTKAQKGASSHGSNEGKRRLNESQIEAQTEVKRRSDINFLKMLYIVGTFTFNVSWIDNATEEEDKTPRRSQIHRRRIWLLPHRRGLPHRGWRSWLVMVIYVWPRLFCVTFRSPVPSRPRRSVANYLRTARIQRSVLDARSESCDGKLSSVVNLPYEDWKAMVVYRPWIRFQKLAKKLTVHTGRY